MANASAVIIGYWNESEYRSNLASIGWGISNAEMYGREVAADMTGI